MKKLSLFLLAFALGCFLVGFGESGQKSLPHPNDQTVEETLQNALSSGRIPALPTNLSVTTIENLPVEHITQNKPAAEIHDPAETLAEFYIKMNQDLPISEDAAIELSVPKSEYVIGEPIIVQATLANISNRPLEMTPLLDPQFQYASYIITTPAGKKLGFSPVAIACSRGNLQAETLLPGETRTQDIPIFFHKQGWIFTEPGQYALTVTFHGITPDVLRLEGNTVTFNVVLGSEADQAAAELIMGHDQGLFLMWNQGDHLEKGIAALEQIVAHYPESVLSLYASYALGSNQAQDFWDGRFNGKIRPANPEKAVEYLAPLAKKLAQFQTPVLPASMINSTHTMLSEAYKTLGSVPK